MSISLLRVDELLIHGQVTFSWTNFLGINTILIINDEVEQSSKKAVTLNLAKPNHVNLYIRNLEESEDILLKLKATKKVKALVLVKTIKDLYFLLENVNGLVQKVNIGQIGFEDRKKVLTKFVAMDDWEINDLKAIEKKGINVELKMFPKDKGKNLVEFDL